MVVPVRERALRIFPPCPNVELKERHWYSVTVWSVDVIHEVTIHLRSGVGGKGGRKYNELDAH
jgi:hypothetical protein